MNLIRKILKGFFYCAILILGASSILTKEYLKLLPLILLIGFFVPSVRQFLSQKISDYSQRTEILIIILLLLAYFSAGKIYLRSHIYRSESDKRNISALYNQQLADFPTQTRSVFLTNHYGKIHVLTAGPDTAPPLLLLHDENMSALSWEENLSVLSQHFRCYAIDHPGEAGQSQLADVSDFPKSEQELFRLYCDIADSLQLKDFNIAAAGSGARTALVLAIYAPERINKLALIAPMGINKPTNDYLWKRIAINQFPLPTIRRNAARSFLGKSETVNKEWGNWYEAVLQGSVPHTSFPMAIAPDKLAKITAPVLLILGNNDQQIGSPDQVKEHASPILNLHVETLEAGHLVAIEKTTETNQFLLDFF